MKVTVHRKVHFNAAHCLHNPSWSQERNAEVFGKCNNPNYHGHNYEVTVSVRGEIDPETGYVIDMKVLKQLIRTHVEDAYDHRNLNLDTEDFRNLNPTAENIAVVIWQKLRPQLSEALDLTIRIHETERNYVDYDGN